MQVICAAFLAVVATAADRPANEQPNSILPPVISSNATQSAAKPTTTGSSLNQPTIPGTASAAPESAASGDHQSPSVATKTESRTGKILADAVHDALVRWAKAKGKETQIAARELIDIYGEILQDSKLPPTQREKLRMSVRGRLIQLLPDVKHVVDQNRRAAQLAKTAGPVPKTVAKNPGNNNAAGANAAAANADKAILAQQGVGPAAAGNAGTAFGSGPNNANADYGQDLVDLIENTISPKSWDSNGGAGTIYYWRAQHALVIRNTGEVHSQISDALDQLNRASN